MRLFALLVALAAFTLAEESSEDAAKPLEEEATSKVVTLTDATFERETQATTGATTGDWFVSFCLGLETCPTAELEALATQLAEQEDNDVNVATVDVDENLALAQRFGVIDASKFTLFSKGKMWQYDGPPALDAMAAFLNITERHDGEKVPRKAGPLKPVHEALGQFFDIVDYRLLTTILCVASIILILIGAFTPHADDDADGNDKKKDDKKD